MRAAYIEKTGSAEEIQYGDLSRPILQDDEVLVKVDAVAVNHVDTFIRSGRYPLPLPSPYIIGRDMVGIVEEIGEAVHGFSIGKWVWSNCLGIDGLQGPSAEYVAVPQARLYPLPEGVNGPEAVSVLHSALTAAIALFDKIHIGPGQTLFISGGSGSVGLVILQFAVDRGAHVAVTAGNAAKAALCEEMGAERIIDYQHEDLESALREFAPQGLDAFIETTPYLDLVTILPRMAFERNLVVIAGLDRAASLPVRELYLRNLTLHGFTVTGTPIERVQTHARLINDALARGILKPNIAQILPLERAAYAHQLQEKGGLSGKLVLVP